jgi:hypothetical protein
MSFGVLTLATPNDYRKAIGLALSVRVSNPGVPVAVACSPMVRPLVESYFDHIVDEDPSLRGFMHKLHLDRYSPFDETFFFDSDVLVFRPLSEVVGAWRGQPYTACGEYVSGGRSPFGLDRRRALDAIGVDKLVHIDGAGHAYFRKPECAAVFDQARRVALTYQQHGSAVRFCDEDVIDIAMTELGLKPMPRVPFWSRHCSGKTGSMQMDAAQGKCQFELVTSPGRLQRPYIMHFAANEAPFTYALQLRRLFKKFGASRRGLLKQAADDFFETQIKWRIKRALKKVLRIAGGSMGVRVQLRAVESNN